MMTMKRMLSLAAVGLVAASFSTSCRTLPPQIATAATICELVEDPSREGHVYAVDAVLKTDNLTFSALVDQRCVGSGSRIPLDGEAPDSDRSVGRFFRATQGVCERMEQPALCGISAELRAEILVERDVGGNRVARLKKVISYRIREE